MNNQLKYKEEAKQFVYNKNNNENTNQIVIIINKGTIKRSYDKQFENDVSGRLLIQSIEEQIELNTKLLTLQRNYTKLNQIVKDLTIKNFNIAEPFSMISNIETLSLINSIFEYIIDDIPIKPIINTLYLSGDESIIHRNLNYFSQTYFDCITKLTIKVASVTNAKWNLMEFLSKYSIFKSIKQLSLAIKGAFISKIDIPKEILPKINSLSLTIYNKLLNEQSSFNSLLQLANLTKFKLIKNNHMTYDFIEKVIANNRNLININIGEEDNALLSLIHQAKFITTLHNLDKIDMTFDQYDIGKLKRITLATFEYSRKNNSILLYGEANLSFYNDNYLSFIIKVIKNNPTLNKIQLCNFDIENIDYLSMIIPYFHNTLKLVLENLNINENFVSKLSTNNLFKSTNLEINNITFLSSEAEKSFYQFINEYTQVINVPFTLKLKNLDDINNYIPSMKKAAKILLEEIYDFNWELILQQENFIFTAISLYKIQFDYDKLSSLIGKSNILSSITIKSDKDNNEDTSIILKILSQYDLNTLHKLKLHMDDIAFTDKIKQDYILNSATNIPALNILDLQFKRLSEDTKEILYTKYEQLKIIK